jgi:hypothetical protein
MSIISAIKEARHENNNLEDLAKLPQTLIMSMVQNGQIKEDMLMPILGKKAEMADNTAKMNAAKALAAQGGAQPTVMDQYMGKIAQAENPAPVMPQQQMQQPMPQEMAQAPMAQGPEDVGIAGQMTAPMQLAGGGIIAFGPGGDVGEDDDYQEMVDDAQEASMNNRLYEMIAGLKSSDVGENRGVGIVAGRRGAERGMEDKGDLESRLRAIIMQKESGGRRYDKDGNLLTSSKGAQGEMQVMPGTARDPGFGIKAARNDSPDELRRVGDEYASMLLSRYQDPKLAMIAYNMGPGATDKWLAAGADIRKLPKETQGYIRGVNLASGGEVRHYDIGGQIDTVGAELDALRSGADSLYQELMRGGSRGGAKTPELQAAYENALALRKQKEAEYQALMAKGGVDKPAFFPQSSLSTKRPEANPIVRREATKADTTAPTIPIEPAKTAAAPAPAKDTPKKDIPQSPEGIKNLQAKVDDENFNLMQYIKGREAKMDAAQKKDYALAGLAAGLGMLGGTSQYAFENIGKGGQMGVQQLASSQKTRAAQEAALGKLYGSAAQTDLMNKLRRDQLGQSAELARERADQSLLTNKNAFIEKRLKALGMDEMMLNTLRRQKATGKLPKDKLADLEYYEQQMRAIDADAERRFSNPRDNTGFSARRIG